MTFVMGFALFIVKKRRLYIESMAKIPLQYLIKHKVTISVFVQKLDRNPKGAFFKALNLRKIF